MGDLRQPPSPMLILAADTLAKSTRALLNALEGMDGKAVETVRAALDAYYAVREHQVITSAQTSLEQSTQTVRSAQ